MWNREMTPSPSREVAKKSASRRGLGVYTVLMNASCLRIGWIVCLVACLSLWGLAPQVCSEGIQDLRLVPFPKRVDLGDGRFDFGADLTLEIFEGHGELPFPLLNAELQRAGLREMGIGRRTAKVPAFRIAAQNGTLVLPSLPETTSTESYSLDVRPHEIVCAAKEPAGLFYGLQTLCQLVRANRRGSSIPCLQIRDWPSLRYRCFQDDLTRGPSSTLETLKFEASLASSLKLNLMTYYMEYQFAFKKHPEIGPTNGSLTAEDLAALVAHAKPLQIDVLGNQQSFGHFGNILRHDRYASLRETSDVLTPAREETYQLLDDLYSEVCPHLPFPWFNVCCDETDGLGTGPSKELASRIGVGGVYVKHIQRVHDLLRDRHQKRMMMWGDIILQHPGNLADLPKDTILLTWGYDARPSFDDQILPFAKAGFDFFVCPGVSDWSRILPDFGVAITNIHNFVRDGTQRGAMGMINTDWQDDGESLKAVKWHADAWAAECAWNASTTPIEAFHRRVGAVLFGEPGDEFGRAVDLLVRAHRLPGMKGMMNARFWEYDFTPKGAPATIRANATGLLEIVRPAIQHLETCRHQAICNQHLLEVLLFGAKRMEFMGQRMLDGLQAAQGYEEARQAPGKPNLSQVEGLLRKNRDTYQQLGREFARLWLAESRPYALDWTLQRYTNVLNHFDTLLGKLQAAENASSTGQPLPPADEIGLTVARVSLRKANPATSVKESVYADARWEDPSATHRLGLVVQAGPTDRFDLPVELELKLTNHAAATPVRAFRLSTNGPPHEILAQLDPLDSQGRFRLVLVLTGPLPRASQAAVHLYFGLAQVPTLLAAAVRTGEAANGMRWMENDRVRLLLGPEGAHIYRWEIKSAANRDLSMPGESGWHGFSDLSPYRSSPYELTCRSPGPAMVEYQATDPSGHTKVFRLYGGASWLEVLLNEPTMVYWDFDDPKNFASDGPTPGQWCFSDGRSGPVGREADGVPAQVKAPNTYWGMKYNSTRLAVGLVTPETATLHVIAPGAGAGGSGIEGAPAVQHFVTFAGFLDAPPAETMDRIQATLDLNHSAEVRVHAVQSR